MNRNYLPGHKQGGSVSRHVIDRLAPFIADLYRSPALIGWLGRLAGERLQLSPVDDPHAYALYFYTRPGDHIGWHYDTSYYAGRRYTLLLGVIDESSCRLDYELHTREPGAAVVPGSVQIPPGGLVFFDGDKLRHRITPFGEGEMRVSLTFEYVTDPRMHPWRRLISNMKDAIAYFGFRQVFRRAMQGGPRKAAADAHDTGGDLGVVSGRAAVHRGARLAGSAGHHRHAGAGRVGLAAGRAVSSAAAGARCGGDSRVVRFGPGTVARRAAARMRDALLARWAGESANSLMPAGQIGGPVLMARHLAQRGMRMHDAAAAITVSTTLQTFAQIAFALLGVAMLGAQSDPYFARCAARLVADRQRLARAAGGRVLLDAAARPFQQGHAHRRAICRQARLVAMDEPGRSHRRRRAADLRPRADRWRPAFC